MKIMNNEDVVLAGKTLKVYRYAVRMGKPVGIREIQRALKLSSPTLASYHLAKLEGVGLLRQTSAGYVVDKMVLRNVVRLGRVLIPRYLFYSLFFATATFIEIVLFKPSVLTREYVFAVAISIIATFAFSYETLRIWLKNRIQIKT
jgi:hypothetical protein